MSAGHLLHPVGGQAVADAPLAWALMVGGALLFAGVMALLAWAVAGPARPVSPRRWIVGGGLLLPLAVLGPLQVANLQHLRAAAPPPAWVVGVSGRLWWWELRLTDPRSGAQLHTANELHLPVGQPVRLALASDDVIHSLWVPALGGKLDLVPGRLQHLVLQADQPGTWRGPCAEFCGTGHARMVLQVVSDTPQAFDAWLHHQAQPARMPQTGLQQRGLQHFTALRCGACHTVRGVSTATLSGPDLTHLASRQHLGAGTVRNDAAGLRAWLTGVQQLKPGARMPSFDHLDAATLDALVAYLASLE
ncbi:MAG TPA: c-type cytochrome [Burkholderiaceae bacterium]|nr:c-type cytochrome [Burkholderiaceae bacterium]